MAIPWRNTKFTKQNGNDTDKKKKLRELYGSVPKSVLWAVYDKYRFDYELFGYDFRKQVLEI